MTEFWNDPNDPNNDEEFRDIPDEVTEGSQAFPAALPRPTQSAPTVQVVGQDESFDEEIEEFVNETEPEDSEEDYSNVLDDARLRLEQGRLYEMVMKHDMFGGLEADPKAVAIVQKQIIKFAKEQMEIMLGMRQPKQQTEFSGPFPFNDLEIKALKMMCSAATGGKSSEPGANQLAQKLNSIGNSRPQSSQTMASVQSKKSLPSTPNQPLQRKKKADTGTDFLLAKGMSKKDVGYKPLKKDPATMTPDELIERNKEAALRQERSKAAKPSNALPQPSVEQEEALYNSRLGSVGGQVAMIMRAVENSRKK